MELEELYSDDEDDVPISKIRLKGIKMKYSSPQKKVPVP